jgi:glutamine amidotransferase
MNVAIIKYNAGNIHSVRLALQRLGLEAIVTDDHDQLKQADKLIFPGVGEANSAMKYLNETGLSEIFPKLNKPVLGICLGLQLMCRYSEENNTPCLNLFQVEVKKFPITDKVPHMGWNTISDLKGPLFKNVKENSYVYFVHSYYAEQNENAVSSTNYSMSFASAIQKENFFAVQFHPEKSADVGEQILKNFLKL